MAYTQPQFIESAGTVHLVLLEAPGTQTVPQFQMRTREVARPGVDGHDRHHLGRSAAPFRVISFADAQYESEAIQKILAFHDLAGQVITYVDGERRAHPNIYVLGGEHVLIKGRNNGTGTYTWSNSWYLIRSIWQMRLTTQRVSV